MPDDFDTQIQCEEFYSGFDILSNMTPEEIDEFFSAIKIRKSIDDKPDPV